MLSDLTRAQMMFVALSQNQHYKVLLSPYMEPEKPDQQSLDDEAALMDELHQKYKNSPPKMMDWFQYKGENLIEEAESE